MAQYNKYVISLSFLEGTVQADFESSQSPT